MNRQPDFCDLAFPNSLFEEYKGYEIWTCTDTSFDPIEGVVHKPIYYEKNQPSKSWAWTPEGVKTWIDSQEPPPPPAPPSEDCLLMAIFGATFLARSFPYLRLFRDLVLPQILTSAYYQFSAWILSIL